MFLLFAIDVLKNEINLIRALTNKIEGDKVANEFHIQAYHTYIKKRIKNKVSYLIHGKKVVVDNFPSPMGTRTSYDPKRKYSKQFFSSLAEVIIRILKMERHPLSADDCLHKLFKSDFFFQKLLRCFVIDRLPKILDLHTNSI